jgi:hypothetical protein
MQHALTVLFRRDASRDRRDGTIHFEGYDIRWPDGSPVAVGLEAFCLHGQRLLGLGRHLAGRVERLLELICVPLRDREDDLTRLPGHRVRRFCLRRQGPTGRLHFLDGTPTETVFHLGRDDPRVLEWIGLPALAPGESRWIDLAARPAE